MKRRYHSLGQPPSDRGTASRRESAAIMVEVVIVFPVLIVVMMGSLEFGMAWRDSTTVATALRTSARTVASHGNDGTADYYALQALKAGLSGIPTAAIGRIVVYNASSFTAPDLLCLSMTAPGGQTGTRACNVYTSASLALASTSFSSSATGACPAAAVDRYFCPLTRDVVQSTVADDVGIYIQVRHDFVTKLFG
ncbi:MAG: TadE family protein, partial [Acidimicrobiales bacterium]